MSNKRLILFIAIGATLVLLSQTWMASNDTKSIQRAEIVFPNSERIYAELAVTQKQKRQGLSGRESMLVSEGMLFMYGTEEKPSYWMKDMHFPIDIIWLRNGEIIDIHKNLQPESPARTLYTPSEAIDQVLEVNSGLVEEFQLKEGELLDIRLKNE